MIIDHVGIWMCSFAEAKALMSDVLGLEMVKSYEHAAHTIAWFRTSDGKTIEVFIPHEHESGVARTDIAPRVCHIGLASDTLGEIVDKARAFEFLAVGDCHWLPNGRKVCFIEVPNQFRIEIMEAGE